MRAARCVGTLCLVERRARAGTRHRYRSTRAAGGCVALAELRVRLNASEVVTSFAGKVREPIQRLQQLGVPIDPSATGSLSVSGQIDPSAPTNSAGRLA